MIKSPLSITGYIESVSTIRGKVPATLGTSSDVKLLTIRIQFIIKTGIRIMQRTVPMTVSTLCRVVDFSFCWLIFSLPHFSFAVSTKGTAPDLFIIESQPFAGTQSHPPNRISGQSNTVSFGRCFSHGIVLCFCLFKMSFVRFIHTPLPF